MDWFFTETSCHQTTYFRSKTQQLGESLGEPWISSHTPFFECNRWTNQWLAPVAVLNGVSSKRFTKTPVIFGKWLVGEDVSNSQLHLHFFVFLRCCPRILHRVLGLLQLPFQRHFCIATLPDYRQMGRAQRWFSTRILPDPSLIIQEPTGVSENNRKHHSKYKLWTPKKKPTVELVAWKYHEVSILKQSYMNL